MKISFLVLLATLSPFLLVAQTSESIQTSRPGNASAPFTVGKKTFQIENGVQFFQGNNKVRQLGNSLYLRKGILERLEINTTLDHNYYFVSENLQFDNMSLGLKVNWLNEKNGKWSAASILNQNFSFWDKSMDEISVNNIIAHSFSEFYTLNFNSRTIYSPNSKQGGSWFVFNNGFSLKNGNSAYVEFSFLLHDSQQLLSRMGWIKIINPNFQIDASIAFDKTNLSVNKERNFGVLIGVSKRFLGQ